MRALRLPALWRGKVAIAKCQDYFGVGAARDYNAGEQPRAQTGLRCNVSDQRDLLVWISIEPCRRQARIVHSVEQSMSFGHSVQDRHSICYIGRDHVSERGRIVATCLA
jgi:hypothetical protein